MIAQIFSDVVQFSITHFIIVHRKYATVTFYNRAFLIMLWYTILLSSSPLRTHRCILSSHIYVINLMF
ncbi:unnamed protein product [Litomosoides sigmodontis]|uniref:Uncharacterized protein n=1 Tax=Litomosoides sigmodontis TaxID=42156 RepID=A0A3P6SK12_LITSI|nr:unnamed protein product [Litomosoides sigmodontis]